jgi:tRNA threonylcarbamoyladenosine biosynthesis protein TsaB
VRGLEGGWWRVGVQANGFAAGEEGFWHDDWMLEGDTGVLRGRYAEEMEEAGEARLLLLDTCGETAGVTLSVGARVLAGAEMGRGQASAEIVCAVRRLLTDAGWPLASLQAVGVVSGPGSFTGMRTGLAVAKGLCEAAGLRLIAVSRLEVLAAAAGLVDGFAVLDAGRGDLFVRAVRSEGAAREFLCVSGAVEEVFAPGPGAVIVAGDARSAERLAGFGARLQEIAVGDSLPVIVRASLKAGEDAALVEANYVREEQDIYPRKVLA